MPLVALPTRRGPRPRTTPMNPHTQLDQTPSRQMYEALAARLFALPSVVEGRSGVSVPGSRALIVPPGCRVGPPDSFLINREFAHVHPPDDGSLHAALHPDQVEEATDTGWVELHPMARMGYVPMNVMMIYGPRDDEELEVIMELVERSRTRAIP